VGAKLPDDNNQARPAATAGGGDDDDVNDEVFVCRRHSVA
jgi:hypothetical protein